MGGQRGLLAWLVGREAPRMRLGQGPWRQRVTGSVGHGPDPRFGRNRQDGRVTSERRVAATALLLDLDGVLVDSTGAVVDHWARWARRRGVDTAAVLALAHGSPSREVIARFVPAAEVAGEADWLEGLALQDGDEVALPGALPMLTQRLLPVAVVTSASGDVARVRLSRAGLPVPTVLVSADDVDRGKPDPQPYLRAAARLGVDPATCVAVEDTPAGLAAVRAAGATALAVVTSHEPRDLTAAEAVLPSLAVLRVDVSGVSWTP